MRGARLAIRRAGLVALAACLVALAAAGCAEDISGSDEEEKWPKLVLESKEPAKVEKPAWIDNERIVFMWDQGTQRTQLWTVNVNTGALTRLVNDSSNDYANPAYSAEYDMVAFEVASGFEDNVVKAKSLSGSYSTTLVSTGSPTFPCWGPDSKAIGYRTVLLDGPAFVMEGVERTEQGLLRLTGESDMFTFGPGTQATDVTWYAPPGEGPFSGKVAFRRIPAIPREGTEIFYYDLDSKSLVHLTDKDSDDGSDDEQPSWSPDGKYVVYCSFKDVDFKRELYVVSISTKDVRRLTRTGDDEKYPAWSPDGTRIAYVSDGNLYLIRVDPASLPE